tara:strand:+ start:694 stop:1446 length:753 start_codon:yes stop_codon:yes gene_type:complete
MVLEKLIPIEKANKRPIYALFFGAIITTISILVGYKVFSDNAGMATLAFIVIGSLPFLRKLISIEESSEATAGTLKRAFKRNKPLIWLFLNFYLGVALIYFFFSMFGGTFAQELFNQQMNVFSGALSHSLALGDAYTIIGNNLGIVTLAIILSLLYGSGAIFILVWNASVLGTFLAYRGIPAMVKYLPHASLEFVGFFMAAIAGGILSEAVEKHDFGGERFKNILRDSILLIILSIVVIVVGAFVEVNVL